MPRSLIKIVLTALIALVPLVCHGAETLKLRPALTVTVDEKEHQLSYPEGVACNDGSVVVADTGNARLVLYSFKEKTLKGGTEIKLAQLAYPIEVQMNAQGGIFVLDGKARRILQLDPQGAFKGYLQPQGVHDPAEFVPRSFKIDAAGSFYLLDILGERVLVTDAAGKVTAQLPFPKPYGFYSDLAVKPNGDVLLLDSVNASIFIAKKSAGAFAPFEPFAKNMQEYLNFATYLTTDSRGVVYIVDHDGGAIISLGQDGAFLGRQLNLGWKSGLVYYPSQICVTATGEIFVADRGNSVVQVFEILK